MQTVCSMMVLSDQLLRSRDEMGQGYNRKRRGCLVDIDASDDRGVQAQRNVCSTDSVVQYSLRARFST